MYVDRHVKFLCSRPDAHRRWIALQCVAIFVFLRGCASAPSYTSRSAWSLRLAPCWLHFSRIWASARCVFECMRDSVWRSYNLNCYLEFTVLLSSMINAWFRKLLQASMVGISLFTSILKCYLYLLENYHKMTRVGDCVFLPRCTAGNAVIAYYRCWAQQATMGQGTGTRQGCCRWWRRLRLARLQRRSLR